MSTAAARTVPLTAGTAPSGALLHHRALGPDDTGIVHLGLGNFHRAHQAVYTAAALAHQEGPWGVLGVAGRSTAVADALRAQDLRYTVAEVSPDGLRCTIPGVHTGALVAAREPERVQRALAAAGTRVISLTVTEHGYTYSPRTGGLDLDHPGVRSDLGGNRTAPHTALGRIVRALQQRATTHGAPVTVLSCDNLVGNGNHTRRLVEEFIAGLPAGERDELTAWIGAGNVTFPNTMVDRIVPATTDGDRAAVADATGVRDEVPVPAEPFTMWVLDDRFAASRPAWEAGGALFADDVEPYELLKVRLLNGTHSLIAYLGALDGCDTIPEATARPFVAEAARSVLWREYLPSLTVPDGVDLGTYVDRLFTRWTNSALGHRTRQVGSDGSAKLRQRIPEPALLHLRAGRMPHHLALTLAAYLCCLAPRAGFDPGEHAAAMTDPARERLGTLRARTTDGPSFAAAVLDDGLLGDELAHHPHFATRAGELIDLIHTHGPRTAAAEAPKRQLPPERRARAGPTLPRAPHRPKDVGLRSPGAVGVQMSHFPASFGARYRYAGVTLMGAISLIAVRLSPETVGRKPTDPSDATAPTQP
ncbi:mannitol dehydrogenase family protein [Streptomyces oryzae]|uniref:Mannitol-1-phosphate 5-dehydrogenase n=1 Tax=Streptomyces oryzae TaxID=1434886 RepID=A0ABS3XEQ5_9ACTN|nr:mannitol dehydrogenase family protein [Streptomyces oryzae]MBO8193875.1 mannitol dehydrogenase family protein [Streptomyces oryzae]